MIVYNRKIDVKDFSSMEKGEELIYYKDNNIAYTINRIIDNNNYIVRKKKIFNNQLVEEKMCKTIGQLEKIVV